MKSVSCIPSLQEYRWALTIPSQYFSISLLSVINKKVDSHLNRNNLLSNKQYGFCTFTFTADILTVIMNTISEGLDNKILDISKAFEKVSYKEWLHNLCSYGISGRVFSVLKSFLTSKSCYRLVLLCHAINAGVPKDRFSDQPSIYFT